MDKAQQQHYTKTQRVRRGWSTFAWRATCACGWESRLYDSGVGADDAASEHVAATKRAPDASYFDPNV